MLVLALEFFDKLLTGLFLDAIEGKIKDYLDRRNVQRTISRCSEAPAQALESYFRNEGIDKNKEEVILDEVKQAITSAGVDAKMLASASLDAEKLTEMVLSKYPVPQRIKEERLEWPFQMSLQISSDMLCNIGTRFSEWEREAWRRSFEAFDKLLQNQNTILKSVGPGGEGSLDERFSHTYRSHVLRRLAQIDASTFRVSSSLFLDLTTVFVQPDIFKVPKSKKKSKTGKKQHDRVISLEEARRQVFSQEGDEDEPRRIKAEEFISKHKKCTIVGLPGAGKTTLLQHILLAIVRGNIPFDTINGLIPVLVRARQLDPANLPGPDDLLRVAEGRVLAGARPGFLRRQLETDKVFLLIDGLDEVVVDKRDDLMKWISDFIEIYPNSRYLISSRPAGYQSDIFQRLGFSEVLLCEFNTNQIREYAHRWTKAVEMAEGATPEEADQMSSRYATVLVKRAERNPYVRRIATNPLMLSTLCLVQRYEGGDLPNRRVVLYQRCIEGLLFHWDNKRGLPPAILGSLPLERKMMLLRRLALQMQVQGVAEIEEKEVERSFRDSLEEVGERTKAKLLLDNIRDRSGLLMERRPHIYGFSHLTFQEYLAALSINQADYRTYDRLFLFSKRENPQWSEVIALYAGIASKDSVESLLKELLSTQKPESVLLSGECLASAQDAGLGIQKEVIRTLLFIPDKFGGPRRYGGFSVQRILESLDELVVMDQVTAVLRNLDVIHSTRYLFFKRDPRSVHSLLEAGRRILTGKQSPAKWDYGVSLILLLIEHSDTAKALVELADIAAKEHHLGDRASVLSGIWSWELWNSFPKREKKKWLLPGVLKFLDDSSATEEQMDLCKFIAVAASQEVIDGLQKEKPRRRGPGRYISSDLFLKTLKTLFERIEYLAQHSIPSVKEHATRASANLSEMIASAKKRRATSHKSG